jgi:hypothetical protein
MASFPKSYAAIFPLLNLALTLSGMINLAGADYYY